MPPTSWEGVRYAQKLPPACIQSDMMYIDEYFPGFKDTSEDCLYLNLYIPEVNYSCSLYTYRKLNLKLYWIYMPEINPNYN